MVNALTRGVDPMLMPQRWSFLRKAAVVKAVHSGRLSIEEACARYALSCEELISWLRLMERNGPRALRAGCLQQYRNRRDSHRSHMKRATPIAKFGEESR